MTITTQTPLAPDRRSFIRNARLSAASISALAFLGGSASAAAKHAAGGAGDIGVINGALAIEHEGIAAYRLAGGSGLLSPGTLKAALVFKGHHEGHRDRLAALVQKMGGTPVEPRPDNDYVSELNLGALKSEGDVVALAIKLEMGAANAYIGQVQALRDRETTHIFSQIGADEAVHWATLIAASGGSVPAQPFIFG